MHFKWVGFGYDEIGTLDEFIKKEDKVFYYNNSIEINKNTESQIAVLNFKLK
ncbi:MAG: hypothetical protein PUE01_14070 [Clostridiaceae bacterium]|nr:hypothetical protein [Clostridiaceae bacterium]